ncbi:hypothetical protein VP01_2951g1 [Puccinia sorghi]|uniref:DDE Tnp4 domain-containing protein n=1 Tax=Puccinia sorghi TaxID=27349 RepID=A0A0L6V2Q6_9BASI|nr:hypothetical protein VP01_2951g1 [Puccinia sorghi]
MRSRGADALTQFSIAQHSHFHCQWDHSADLWVCQPFTELATETALVIVMAILALSPRLLTWPTSQEHQQLKKDFAEVGFDKCIGAIDGTLCILQNRTEQLLKYSICVHWMAWFLYDQWLTSNSGLTINPTHFFSNGQYLLAKSAFNPSNKIVAAFKSLSGFLDADVVFYRVA